MKVGLAQGILVVKKGTMLSNTYSKYEFESCFAHLQGKKQNKTKHNRTSSVTSHATKGSFSLDSLVDKLFEY